VPTVNIQKIEKCIFTATVDQICTMHMQLQQKIRRLNVSGLLQSSSINPHKCVVIRHSTAYGFDLDLLPSYNVTNPAM